MAKAPFDPYTLDLFENLLPLEDGVEVETNHANEAPDQTGDIELTTKVDHAADWIADFGEKIGGAKKDLWANYAQDLQLATEADFLSQPFSKVWPSPNYQRMLAAGADPYQVAFVRTLRESITPKPKSGYKARAWVGRSLVLRDLCADLLSGRQSTDSAKQFLSTNTRLTALTHKIALYELLGHERSLANFELSLHSYSRYQGVDYQPAKLLWVLSERRSKTSWPRELLSAETYSQIIDRIDQQRESLFPSAISANGRAEGNLGQRFSANSSAFIIFSERTSIGAAKQYFIGKKIGKHYAKLAGPYGEVAIARDYREQNLATLEERLEQFKAIPNLRKIFNDERIGRDYRQGANITPQAFSDAFGFKGVEFGNWVAQGRRQEDLNDAFDALMDLAQVVDLPARALSLNGQLSLAFGARGSGGANPAKAHYEPDRVVINLTKNQGSGSLAHEWWHALDHYFSRANGQALGFMTDAVPINTDSAERLAGLASIRPEVVMSFGNLVKTIELSPFAQRSGLLDLKRSKEYWATRIELSARAFESYVIDRLEREGFSNDYLANIVSQAYWDGASKPMLGQFSNDASSYPYPTTEELANKVNAANVNESIGQAFDHLFQTLEVVQENNLARVFCTREDKDLAAFEKLSDPVGVGGGFLAGGELATPRAGLIFGPTVTREVIRSAMEHQIAALNKQMLHQIPFTLETSIRSAFPSIDPRDAQSIKGATIGDRIYLFTDAASSELDIQRTMFHELLHYGIRRYLTEDEFITSMTQLYQRDREIKKEADKWISVTPEGQEALANSGPAYAIARGVDEALAQLAQDRSAWVMHLRNEQPTQWQTLSRNLLDWSANLAQRLGLSKIAAYFRGKSQSEALDFIDSIFHKLAVDATPSPDPFTDHRYALRREGSRESHHPHSFHPLNEELSMSRIADRNKPPYVDFIPFDVRLPPIRQGDGPIWDPAITPTPLLAAIKERFGSVREFVVPQRNGGPYQGECFQIDEYFLAQEIGPRQVTVHRLAHMETRSAAVAYQLPLGLDSVYLSIDYHGARAQVYPYDPQKNQFIEVCKTVEKTMHARGVSTRDQARFKSMWRVSCEDVMRARMGWQRARDVVGPRYKTPGILDPVYQNLYSPYAVPSPHRPNTPASDPRPLGVPVNLQTTYFPRGPKPAPVAPQFLGGQAATTPSPINPLLETRRTR